MHWLHALLLGLVQGLTEFFPVSSSAHLKFLKIVLGVEGDESPLFDLACHLGTLLPLTYCFRKEIGEILFFDRKKFLALFLALLPLVPFYFLARPLREAASAPLLLGFFLMFTAALLFLASKFNSAKSLKPSRDPLLIGTMQALALIPGISRSGATISGARLLGWSAEDAVRFSFLLAIPAILGGTLLEGMKAYHHASVTGQDILACSLGFGAAFISGSLVIKVALRWLERGNLKPFAWYCLSIGILMVLYLL